MRISLVKTKKNWESFVLASDQASFLQSWNWGEFNQRLGHKIYRLGFYQASRLQGVALVITKQAKRATFLECPAGPIIPWQEPKYFSMFISRLRQLGLESKSSFARIRPNIPDTAQFASLFRSHQLIRAPMHLHAETTWLLDITPSPEDLLKAMRKSTRYSIKQAQKLGVKIKQSLDPQDIKILHQLQSETVARHHFSPFPLAHFQAELNIFKPDHQIQLFKAVYKGKVLVVSMIIFYGQEAIYHYSGSSNQFRHIPASALLLWNAIEEAKKRQKRVFNFWGIAKTADPRHRFAGVTLFKQGFGGYRQDFLPAHDLVLNWRYWFDYGFETLRKHLRRL
jgi:peptidoglycan pentaglycine glycine transferase (the first glycine)